MRHGSGGTTQAAGRVETLEEEKRAMQDALEAAARERRELEDKLSMRSLESSSQCAQQPETSVLLRTSGAAGASSSALHGMQVCHSARNCAAGLLCTTAAGSVVWLFPRFSVRLDRFLYQPRQGWQQQSLSAAVFIP